MLSIENYLLMGEAKRIKLSLIWLLFIIFIITISIIFCNNYKIYSYYQNRVVLKDSNYYTYILIDDMTKVLENNELFIDNNKYKYEVKSIDEKVIEEGIYYYQEVVIDIKTEDLVKIENNSFKVNIVTNEQTILEYILELIRGK